MAVFSDGVKECQLFKTNAIVTRSLNYGESDKIVTFFSKDYGKIRGIAKGARRSRKRFQNALGLFSHIRLIFFDREGVGLVRAESGDILHTFPGIRENLAKIYYGNYFLELVNEMAGEREANPEAFHLLLSFLLGLQEGEPEEERLRMFEIRMLSLFGYRPSLKRCDVCKKDWEDLREMVHLFFSPEKGAMVCEGCSKMLTERLAGARAIGPLLQGLAQPVHDLSRGCSTDDVLDAMAVAAVQALERGGDA